MLRLVIIILLLSTACSSKQNDTAAGVCISFDDRSVEEWQEVVELLRDHGAKATFFITQFDSLTEKEISILKGFESYGNEIGSHGYNHINAEAQIKKHGYQWYIENEITPSIKKMEAEGFTIKSFAYPYGAKFWFTDFILSNYFLITRGVADDRNIKNMRSVDGIYYDKTENGSAVNALNFDKASPIKNEQILTGLKYALEKGKIINLFAHAPSQAGSNNKYTFEMERLEYILINAKELGLKFYTAAELNSNL
jgi:peptidoglycan/xylan/chitin deacetylase (PgdA/CDA1 family)